MKSTEFRSGGRKMDELKQIISELEQQELSFQNDLNNAIDDDQAQTIVNELNIVRNKLSEKRHELQQLQEKEQARAEVIEERVHAEEIPLAIAGIDFTELPAEVITLIDAVVKADRRRLLNEHDIELEQTEERWKTEVENMHEWLKNASGEAEELKVKADELLEVQKELNFKLEDVKRVNANLNELLADAESKRDAAVQNQEDTQHALDEALLEIKRLNEEIEDLKRAQEYNNRHTEQVTANDEEKASITAALAAVKKLYTNKEDWGSSIKVDKPDGTFELVKRKEFETEWQSVDVPSFRPEDTDSNAQDNTLSIAETAATVEPPQFQTDDTVQGEHVLDGAVASEAVGQAETWEQWVERSIIDLYEWVAKLDGNDITEIKPPKR